MPLPHRFHREGFHGGQPNYCARRLAVLLQEIEDAPQRAPAAHCRHGLCQAVIEDVDCDTIHVDQADERQRRGDLAGIVQFGRRAEIHRAGQVIDRKHVEVQIFFFQEQANEQAVEPCVEVPVEETKIVPLDVVAIIRELDALPLAAAAAFSLDGRPAKILRRDELQLLQTSEKLGVEQRGLNGGFGHGDIPYLAVPGKVKVLLGILLIEKNDGSHRCNHMSPVVNEWMNKMSELSKEDRAELAFRLLESLEEPADPDWESAWAEELQQRVHSIEQGAVAGIPAEEVLAKLRQKYS